MASARDLASRACGAVGTRADVSTLYRQAAERDRDQVTDGPTLERLAGRYRESGWPAEVEGEAFTAPFSAPSAGRRRGSSTAFTLHTAFGVATAEPYGATRWRFGSP